MRANQAFPSRKKVPFRGNRDSFAGRFWGKSEDN